MHVTVPPPAPPPPPPPDGTKHRPAYPHTAGHKAFYRPQSCFSRDLAVLSAVVHRRQQHQQQQQRDGAAAAPLPPLHVCDAMAGSGIRSMRYLLQAEADYGVSVAVTCAQQDRAVE